MSFTTSMDARPNDTLAYSRRRRTFAFGRRWVIAFALCVAGYLGLYGVSLALREPAANMNYYYYNVQPPLTDTGLYHFFYPAYAVHKAIGFPAFVKHNLDRPTVMSTPNEY
jgi:hypothetical protein